MSKENNVLVKNVNKSVNHEKAITSLSRKAIKRK